jgi:SAM-dependent methyltransferase/UDP-N-acetylenolpyruvoylglucosamine reductase
MHNYIKNFIYFSFVLFTSFISTEQETKLIPYGKHYNAQARIVCPQSVSDIQLIIYEAQQAGKSISIFGKSMSQGKQAVSNEDWNIAISTSQLNKINIDPLLKIARVGSGTSWEDLQRKANQYGLAVRVMQASNIFSIGGSISANCHGWDFKTGPLRNTLIALTIVDPNGKVLEITPEDALFDYIIGGYGAFGVIAEATISLTENLNMIKKETEIAPCNYAAYFNQKVRDNETLEMHLYRLSLKHGQLFDNGIAVNYHRIDDMPTIARLTDEPRHGNNLNRMMNHSLRRMPWNCRLAWNGAKKSLPAEKISSRNELMCPPSNFVLNNSKIDKGWVQEYFVKEEDLAPFLIFLKNILEKNKVVLFNASVRFVKYDPKTKLSYTRQGDRFAVDLFLNQKLSPKAIQKTKAWVQEVIDYLIAHDGAYYLAYQHFATQEQFKACYPNWQSVCSFRKSFDPNSLFNNGFFDDYLSPQASHSIFRKVFSLADGQRDGIRDFLNNVFMALDERKFFMLVDSILENPHLNDEQIYEILYSRIGEAKPNILSYVQQTLASLRSLKEDLGDLTTLLVGTQKINGYVEIGYPGRMIRPLKDRLKLKAPLYVIHDKESLSDYVEAGFPLPYNQFIPLNDYAPISENDLPGNCVDLVCLYIGLHHVPEEKIDPFIASIKRILRPGGTFILMEHDARTKELKNLADAVHTIFNAATGVSPELNRQEIRNFHSLQYWIERLEYHGFGRCTHDPLIRKGDSTLNSLIRFIKPSAYADVSENPIDKVEKRIMIMK